MCKKYEISLDVFLQSAVQGLTTVLQKMKQIQKRIALWERAAKYSRLMVGTSSCL
jgi:hypothetical protein